MTELTSLEPLRLGFASLLGLAALPGTLELALVTSGAWRTPRIPRVSETDTEFRLAVVIPAHNEEKAIAPTVAGVLRAIGRDAGSELFVIADNCADLTALRAAEAGATVLIRNDSTQTGKSAALRFAFGELSPKDFDGYLILDADSSVDSELIESVRNRLASGAAAVQCRNVVSNSEESPRTALLAVALTAFNGVRPRGRARWGLSAGPLANGFAVRCDTLSLVPFAANSIVEDLEYQLLLVDYGLSVEFADEAAVQSPMPSLGPASASQRCRWEGGRLRVASQWIARLGTGVARGHWRLAEPLAELLTLPLAFHASLLAIWTMASLHFGILLLAAMCSWTVLFLHAATALAATKNPLSAARALAFAPAYLIWKLRLIPQLLRAARPEASWMEKQHVSGTR